MKKFLSVFLAGLMLVFCLVPAVNTNKANASTQLHWDSTTYPIVIVGGDGSALYDAEGNKLIKFKDIIQAVKSSGSDDSDDSDGTTDAVKNILSALVKGIQTDDYTEYYEVFYEEISDLFEGIQLDKNGEVTNGSGISQANKDFMVDAVTHDSMAIKGYYANEDYHFWYDWRLDPYVIADELHAHIEAVKNVTHKDKVILLTRCVGTQVALAYVEKYGMDSIFGIGFDGGTMNGADVLSEAVSGKFTIDGNAAIRFINDLEYYGLFDGFDEFTMATIDMLSKCGGIDMTKEALKATIYEKIAEGVTSSLARATFFGFPVYWASVTAEDYDDAIKYVFGEEGSEKRTEYAGLIEKIENYHNKVVLHMDDLLKEIDDSGCNVCVIAKYGSQMIPICKSMNKLSDQIISVNRASLGATTSNIMETLSDDYIQQQTDAGLGKYISPDKQIDASTCYWPDNTWFVKGVTHSDWSNTETKIMDTVLSSTTKLTVDDLEISQFFVAIPTLDADGNLQYSDWNSYMIYDCVSMTEENCHSETWAGEVNPDANTTTKVVSGFASFLNWFTLVIEKVRVFLNTLLETISSKLQS